MGPRHRRTAGGRRRRSWSRPGGTRAHVAREDSLMRGAWAFSSFIRYPTNTSFFPEKTAASFAPRGTGVGVANITECESAVCGLDINLPRPDRTRRRPLRPSLLRAARHRRRCREHHRAHRHWLAGYWKKCDAAQEAHSGIGFSRDHSQASCHIVVKNARACPKNLL